MKKHVLRRPVSSGRWRRLVGWLSVALALWSLVPLFSGVLNVGVTIPFGVGCVGALWGFMPPSGKPMKGWRRVMAVAAIVVLCLVAALAVLIAGLMTAAALQAPPREDATVVVLGARVVGENPSRMLRHRLDAAAAYLESHPAAACVVTGGQGPDEICTEASVMERYLVKKGIAPERIFREEQATDTHQNIQYSLEIIRREGLPEELVIATQEFHQYRAAQLAKRAGVPAVGAATCLSPPHLFFCYWVRECAAICRLWLIGY